VRSVAIRNVLQCLLESVARVGMRAAYSGGPGSRQGAQFDGFGLKARPKAPYIYLLLLEIYGMSQASNHRPRVGDL